MSRPEFLPADEAGTVLAEGDMEVLGHMPRASNHTFAATVRSGDRRVLVIYKPQAGETPLWDFPDGTLYAREVAAHVVCRALGWSFVPPTIARVGTHGLGSVQLCINAEPTEHYLSLLGGPHDDEFRRICAFDVVVNNADRKSGHVMREQGTGAIYAVDHGTCFAADDKLRTVIWDFAGEKLPDEVVRALEALTADLIADGATARRLAQLLSEDEVSATAARAGELLTAGVFPDVPQDRRPFPWPPV